jgi:hypothetical protein
MATDDTLPSATDESFSRIGCLVLTTLIQVLAFGVFMVSLHSLGWRALDRWPFLVTEFVTVVGVCFGCHATCRDLRWHLDGLDILIPFLFGLLQCVAMLILGMVPDDALWWFVCYLGINTVALLALFNARMKTPATAALPLLKRRAILGMMQMYVLLLATVACYWNWHVQLIGILFMAEQIGLFMLVCFFDVRLRAARWAKETTASMQSAPPSPAEPGRSGRKGR